ncbi:MAG: T9SS type B sorting domain-containing protein [Sphingobacteriales bacterium]|nr:MAG: T9SS type B sorting domain-containing protein [Sphingobacteriales bacterium]
MKSFNNRSLAYKIASVVAIMLLSVARLQASHIYGADLSYTHINDSTYQVKLIIYGDCGGSIFSTLSSASPQVTLFNGPFAVQTRNLTIQAPVNGTEITPVCASQLGNTNCVNPSGTVPGVKKFTYMTTFSVKPRSANWKFQFTGNMSATSSAGRSNSITNISFAPPNSGSVMMLEATLNNLNVNNTSPEFTNLPTPFFCINKAAGYNLGSVDANGDSLVYSLVNGLDATTGTVSYAFPYSGASPLSASSGTFGFNTSTGQLSFTPNIAQRSLVVYKVSEYRGGVLIGTSMREMTFVVLNNCNNSAPSGGMTGVTGATVVDTTTIKVCQSIGPVNFNINPADPDGNTITVTSSGVPAGATFSIANNGTTTPAGTFSWNVSTVAAGTYNFFLTYTDNGCPLSSTQTQAYTIVVLPDPTAVFNLVSPATCFKKAVYTVTPGIGSPWSVRVLNGTTAVDSNIGITGMVTDSIIPGTYTIRTTNTSKCYKDINVTFVNPSTVQADLSLDRPTCNALADGSISVTGYNSTGPYQYAIGTANFASANNFASLPAGTYLVRVRDNIGCTKDTLVALNDSVHVNASYTLKPITCNGDDDASISVTASAGVGAPYKYSLDAGTLLTKGGFTNLPPANYLIRAQDALGCFKDTIITVVQPPVLVPTSNVVNVHCYGYSSGSITEVPAGGVKPYEYSFNGGAFSRSDSFKNLKIGTYTISVKDLNGCIRSEVITITQPAQINLTLLKVIHPQCFDSTNGRISFTAAGGVPPFTYALNGGMFDDANVFTNLGDSAHVIHIKDANNCIRDTSVPLVPPPPFYIQATATQPTCNTIANGTITLTPVGGKKPYTYSFGDGNYAFSRVIRTLGAGVHNVSIKDSANCIVDTTIVLTDSIQVGADVQQKDISCYGLADGRITVVPNGGVAPYKAALNNTAYQDAMIFSGHKPGSYTLAIKDALGCTYQTIIPLVQPELLTTEARVVNNNCYGKDTAGRVELTVLGGTKPYSYTWSNNAKLNTNMATSLPNGSYFTRIIDANGCRDSLVSDIVYEDCCTPYVPNAFTPNGDGRNDVFRVMSKGDMKLIVFKVFNRFGQMVFETTDMNKGWDGVLNGTQQDLGTYFYYLKATCGLGAERELEMKGDVILIR